MAPTRTSLVTASLCVSQFVVTYANSCITAALPTIAVELNISDANIQWPIIAFSIAYGGFLVLFGRIADQFGKKRMQLVGLAWSLIWALVAVFSRNEIMLDIAMAMQGLGAAIGIPAALGIMSVIHTTEQSRNAAISFFGAMNPLGAVSGIILGAVFTQTVGWRYMFFVPLALEALALVVGALSIPASVDHHLQNPVKSEESSLEGTSQEQDVDNGGSQTKGRVNGLGAVLITAGFTLLTFALAGGPVAPDSYKTSYIIAAFLLAALSLIAYVLLEFKFAKNPLVPRTFWKIPGMPLLMAMALVVQMSFFSLATYCTFFFQRVYLETPLTAALHFVPIAIMGFIVATLSGYIFTHVRNLFALIVFGSCLLAAACAIFGTAGVDTSYWVHPFPGLILSVTGFELIFNSLSIKIITAVPPSDRAIAGAMFNTCVQLGQALTLSIAVAVVSTATDGYADPTSPQALAAGYGRVLLMDCGFAVAAGLLACFEWVRSARTGAAGPTSARKDEDVVLGESNDEGVVEGK
ncbi:MFS general substrate transporter [Gonapodya prolifera JEL478]|uniref:MFS general substrate transporter n=1 Tax=Gonapodya prolifera (strain JEL478) TaxID=1344416 RepID=A0A139AGA6_GONPJ|nr:MFS general substrate transporter [Gonapodya prolifera JEL478]|eukprot:KXS15827.1 MFS general substrate transporter [Gonapodya prolifera JEL478]